MSGLLKALGKFRAPAQNTVRQAGRMNRGSLASLGSTLSGLGDDVQSRPSLGGHRGLSMVSDRNSMRSIGGGFPVTQPEQFRMQHEGGCRPTVKDILKKSSPLEGPLKIKEELQLSLDELKTRLDNGEYVGFYGTDMAGDDSIYTKEGATGFHAVVLVGVEGSGDTARVTFFDPDPTSNPQLKETVDEIAAEMKKKPEDVTLEDLKSRGMDGDVFRTVSFGELKDQARTGAQQRVRFQSGNSTDYDPRGFMTVEKDTGMFAKLKSLVS